MKVYALYEYFPYEDVETKGVYATEELAKKGLLAVVTPDHRVSRDGLQAYGTTELYIKEHEVQE